MDVSSSLRKHGHASERRRRVAQRKSSYVQEHEDRLELDYSGNEVAREDDVSHGEDIGCGHASDREGDGGEHIVNEHEEGGEDIGCGHASDREGDGGEHIVNEHEEGGEDIGCGHASDREGDGGEHIVNEHKEGGEDIIPRAEKPKTKRKPKKSKVPDVLAINGVPMNGPYPGGPKDNSLLTSFYNHVALHVWFGEERGPLKVIHHTKKLKEWVIKPEWSYFSEMLSASGLRNLADALPLLNKSLISAFVERWHPETSSFHLPVGEMTITLDDVKQITGLSIEGDLLSDFEIGSIEEAVDLVHRCLGVEKELIRDELKFNNDQMNLRFEWIKKQMSGKEASHAIDSGNESSDAESEEPEERHKTIEFALRGYLLYCLGCNLFSDKTGNKVSISYLRFLENLAEVENFAWGASGLAFLYKALESSSRANCAQVTGFLALLEVWIYEHFPTLRGKPNSKYKEPEPRMKRWKPCGGVIDADAMLVDYRQKIDQLTNMDVTWDPYYDQRSSTRPIPEIAFYEGLLSCVDIAVPYMPNRVLRQFGLCQILPLKPASPHGNYYGQWTNHLFARDNRVPIINNASDCADGYIEWFNTYSHPKVQNTTRWIGPSASRSAIPSGGNSNMENRLDHARDAEGILASLIRKGKKYCGKVYGDIKKAHEHLVLCGSGAPAPMVVEEENDESDEEERRRASQTKKRRPRKKN